MLSEMTWEHSASLQKMFIDTSQNRGSFLPGFINNYLQVRFISIGYIFANRPHISSQFNTNSDTQFKTPQFTQHQQTLAPNLVRLIQFNYELRSITFSPHTLNFFVLLMFVNWTFISFTTKKYNKTGKHNFRPSPCLPPGPHPHTSTLLWVQGDTKPELHRTAGSTPPAQFHFLSYSPLSQVGSGVGPHVLFAWHQTDLFPFMVKLALQVNVTESPCLYGGLDVLSLCPPGTMGSGQTEFLLKYSQVGAALSQIPFTWSLVIQKRVFSPMMRKLWKQEYLTTVLRGTGPEKSLFRPFWILGGGSQEIPEN